MKDGEEYMQYKRRPSLCGLSPRHGWGLDLFVDEECSRCCAAMAKREKAGEVFIDLADVWKARREEKLRKEAEDEERSQDD